MGNDTSKTILYFFILVMLIGLIYGIGIVIATYPSKFWIKKIYKNLKLEEDVFYFYIQRAAGYRMLFMIHTFFGHLFKVMGTAALFITVYFAVGNDNKNLILLFSLIAAMCQVIVLIIPVEKFVRIYTQAARIMEYSLLSESAGIKKEFKDYTKAYKKLRKAYMKAEKYIRREYM